ncbi:hypothetical protein MATL_G00173750 [Megalops atlanticus]|uniref:Immunoglobulin V-set domain-containing protein n=1 Tax=Megalops atlanticus TaxID=7932 RepID=A0A9D3T3I2_MEGAT|nr:hypothetical protein MATL_G00173750 [Megalops atlanticus]
MAERQNIASIAIISLFLVSVSGSEGAVTVLATAGSTVILDLVNVTVSEHNDIKWTKGPIRIAQIKWQNKTNATQQIEILANGSLQLRNVQKQDNGFYKAEVYDKDGRLSLNKTFQLIVTEQTHSQTVGAILIPLAVLACLVLVAFRIRSKIQNREPSISES